MSTPAVPRPNPSRVNKPVTLAVVLGLVVAGAARALLDAYVDPADQAFWWNAVQTAIVPGIPAALAWLASKRAEGNVTPIRTDLGDTPRNLDGERLEPASHGPAQGYPRDVEEQAERQHRSPRVDRRGIDRDRPGR